MTTEEFKANIMPHYMSMYRVAATVMISRVEAADAVQDAIIRLWDKRDKLNNISDLKSYCISVVRNVCINSVQRKKMTTATETTLDIMSDENVHDKVEWRDFSDFVGRAINRLPANQRYVLRLSAYGGFSNAEIADLLGMTQGNVRVLLSRARNRLKELLSK